MPEEDLEAKGQIETTITDVDMNADDWLEQASEQVKAVKGSTYIELDRGLLTVDQLDALLKSMPFEITYADANNQFLYYNHNKETEEMLAKRRIEQVGNPSPLAIHLIPIKMLNGSSNNLEVVNEIWCACIFRPTAHRNLSCTPMPPLKTQTANI